MIFTSRQLQEKCREQITICLWPRWTSVHSDLLWKVLLQYGCMKKFVNILWQFHDPFGMGFGVRQGVRPDRPPSTVREVRGRGRGRQRWCISQGQAREESYQSGSLKRREWKASKGTEDMQRRFRLLHQMILEEHRELTTQLLERQPGLVFDALMMHQCRHAAPPFAGVPGVPWCSCGNCREMPTDRERKCCGQEPANCVSHTLPVLP
ncbi:hypothetical protein N1851_032634 [Merluccius polli]|uniref:Uncharacterized protein n=1 Tax=Merluccius polli TaxID=89951 RepID=A0AA47M2S2_MERPO|nr:hypothetical protein N1851_032634 [Merluccius polli]